MVYLFHIQVACFFKCSLVYITLNIVAPGLCSAGTKRFAPVYALSFAFLPMSPELWGEGPNRKVKIELFKEWIYSTQSNSTLAPSVNDYSVHWLPLWKGLTAPWNQSNLHSAWLVPTEWILGNLPSKLLISWTVLKSLFQH